MLAEEVLVRLASVRPSLYGSRSRWETRFANQGLWPHFMAGGIVAKRFGHMLDEAFLDCQFVAVRRDRPMEVIGVGHSVAMNFNGLFSRRGWDWALETAASQFTAGFPLNTLCGLSVTVFSEFQGNGVGRAILLEMIRTAKERNYLQLIVPARPTGYTRNCKFSFREYAFSIRSDGLPVDRWLRTHVRCGGQIIEVCDQSMTILGTQEQWEQWTLSTIPKEGQFWPAGALAPIRQHLESEPLEYVEPNRPSSR